MHGTQKPKLSHLSAAAKPAMEALQRALSEQGLTVSTLPDKGRCLFTTRDFLPGEVIVRENPYVWVTLNSGLEPRCDGCLEAKNLKKCSACHLVWYCGTKCQEMWKLHRLECAAVSKLTDDKKRALTPYIHLMVRLCIRKKLEAEKVIPATAMENNELVKALVSHMSDVNEKDMAFYGRMANLVNSLQLPDMSRKELIENFSKLACNEHSMHDHHWRHVGCGLFLVIAMINHSCVPNSVLACDGKSAVIRAMEHIPKDSEVTISYIETAGSTMTRRKTLKEQYYFTCKCLRCIKVGQFDDIRESAILEGYRCKNSGCDGFLLCYSDEVGFICQHCQLVRSKQEIEKIASEIKPLSEKALSPAFSQHYQEAISTYKAIEKLQMKLYHRFSVSLMRTREKLNEMLVKMLDLSAAVPYCRLTISTYERVYPEFHPLLGLQYYTCGKLELALGDKKNAVKSLNKAVDILRIVCGNDSSLVKELLVDVDNARGKSPRMR